MAQRFTDERGLPSLRRAVGVLCPPSPPHPRLALRHHGLRLCVDRLTTTARVFAPVRDETPFQEVERTLAGRVVLADEELLGRRAFHRRG
jgi:hypothetical protein